MSCMLVTFIIDSIFLWDKPHVHYKNKTKVWLTIISSNQGSKREFL